MAMLKTKTGLPAVLPDRPVVAHLLDDFGLGGVTRSFAIFREPRLADAFTHDIRKVEPMLALAPRLDADVIVTHFTPNWQKLPFVLSLRARNPKARLVHIEHSYTRAWEALMVPDRRRFRAMMRLWTHVFDAVAGVSAEQAAWVAEAAALDPASVGVIRPWSGRHGLDTLEPPGPAGIAPLVIGAYGRLAFAKGFDILIDAMKRLDPARFLLLIGGYGPDEPKLKEQAAGLEHVRFVGTVTDVPAFLRRCDAVVVPSRWEAFGAVAMEAKLAARPIVTSAFDGLPEQVGSAGFVADALEPAALARLIERLPEMNLARIGLRGRAALADAEAGRCEAWLRLLGGAVVA